MLGVPGNRKEAGMLWTELTPSDFLAARERAGGVCVLPVASIERHGGHLPLGCDTFGVEEVCRRAARREPFVFFPPLPLGVNREAAANPGGVGLGTETLHALILDLCDEIARNGFGKILLCSGHGGNRFLLPLIVQQWTARSRDYLVYYYYAWKGADEFRGKLTRARPEVGRISGHGGQLETSLVMAHDEKLVRMDQRIPDNRTAPAGRLDELHRLGVYTPVSWYADYPYHFSGPAEGACPELGEEVADVVAAGLAEVVAALKRDEQTPRVWREFTARGGAGGTLEIPAEE
jgi:creatinine amidohydrolase